MPFALDHVVLWVADPLRSVAFYEEVVGFPGLRVAEFRAGTVPFPSVRVSEETILDLMPLAFAKVADANAGAFARELAGSAGHPVSHVCFSMEEDEMLALRARLEAHGVATGGDLTGSYGARGLAPRTFYFHDLDRNVLEARYYLAR